jgi:hypothetical protein
VTLRRDVANGLTLGIPINEEVELEGDGLLVPGNYGGLSND